MSASNRWTLAPTFMLFSWASVRAQFVEEVVKVHTALVTFNVSVTNAKGHHLPGLQAENFLVTDEGAPVRLEFLDGYGPASIVFVIDTSFSMAGAKWKNPKAGMKKFLARARQDNDYTLIYFDDCPRLVAESVSAHELWQSLTELDRSGHTALYDGVLLGLEALSCTRRN